MVIIQIIIKKKSLLICIYLGVQLFKTFLQKNKQLKNHNLDGIEKYKYTAMKNSNTLQVDIFNLKQFFNIIHPKYFELKWLCTHNFTQKRCTNIFLYGEDEVLRSFEDVKASETDCDN